MPPAEKRRVRAKRDTDKMEVEEISSPDADLMSKLQTYHAETMSNLQSDLDLLTTTSGGTERDDLIFSCSVALSTLKLLQRQISLEVENHHATVAKDERSKVETCSLMLQNLNYERNYLRREIEELKGWKAEELEKMAGDELGLDMTFPDGDKADGSAVIGDTKVTTPEEAINAYLFGNARQSYRDPSNHEAILAKLEGNKETRLSLVEQLTQSKLELKELQTKRDELRNFLVQIPKKLGEMEKVGESLSGFFKECKAEWLCNDGDSPEKKMEVASTLVCPPSVKRTQRFQLAQSNLASPLYALFIQLSGYVDAWSIVNQLKEDERNACNLGGFVGADGMNVAAVPSGSNEDDTTPWNVELSLSTINILPAEIATLMGRTSKAGEGTIKIVFTYDTNKGMVFARVASDTSKTNDDDLLDNLFPGDDGSRSPNVSNSIVKCPEEEIETNDKDALSAIDSQNTSNNAGKPYHWCQFLSGLNFPPCSSCESKDLALKANICVKTVFRQLFRRIRARRSLSVLLDFIGRRGQNLPIHPAFRTSENNNSSPHPKAKIVSWTEERDTHNISYSPFSKRYIATIKRKSSTLKAAVVIDFQNYPAKPPIWSLQNEDGTTTGSGAASWGEENGDLASLQESNSGSNAPPLFDATLHRIETRVNTDLDKFVTQEVESTYDWILVHQLVDIISCWDEVMGTGEGNSGNRENTKETVSRRLRKGKDRRLVGFGEQSPFFYYRHGL